MRYILIVFFTTFLASTCLTQPTYDAKRDYVWIFGGQKTTLDSTSHILFDFSYDTMTLRNTIGQGANYWTFLKSA